VANKVFVWYAMHKVFIEHPFPLKADPFEMWAPLASAELVRLAKAITFADNECLELRFPANNPVRGAPQIFVRNPLSPNNPESYWTRHAFTSFSQTSMISDRLVGAVHDLYSSWKTRFRAQSEIVIDVDRDYYVGGHAFVNQSSGLLQIKDFIETLYAKVQVLLKEAKTEFHSQLVAKDGVDYFGASMRAAASPSIVTAIPRAPAIKMRPKTAESGKK
jgi:hypothetical protein